ncbi:MAG: CAP domain-containing protein [Actinomycetota bacterium]
MERLKTMLCVSIVAALIGAGLPSQVAVAGTSSDQETMADLTNRARERRDIRPLSLNRQLSDYAQRHSAQMARRGRLFHTGNLARVLDGINWSRAGENVGVGGSLPVVQDAFMNSPGHRANILDRRFDHVATGVVHRGGRYWITVIFYG